MGMGTNVKSGKMFPLDKRQRLFDIEHNTKINATPCRVCGKAKLRLGLDLGLLPLANSFLTPQRADDPTPDPRYPLRLFYCDDCHLIQLSDIVNKREMYDDYAFLTATADTSLSHFSRYADHVTERFP